MRSILVFILCLFGPCLYLQAQQIDSVRVYSASGQELFRFTPQDSIQQDQAQFPALVGDTMYSLTRDALGRPTKMLVITQSTNLPLEQHRWVYNQQGQLILQSMQRMNHQQEIWRNQTRTEYFYDTLGHLTCQLQSEWNGVYWKPVSRWQWQFDDESQYSHVSYEEPLFHQWYSRAETSYERQDLLLQAQYAASYWSPLYGQLRDSYLLLNINQQRYSFFGYALDAYYTPEVTSLEAIKASSDNIKYIRNGQLFIRRNGRLYDALGRLVEE